VSPSARTQGVSGRPPRSRSPALDLSLDGIVLQHVAIAVRATVAAGGPMTYDECMGKLVTVRIMSDAICGKPGITAMVLSERIDYPLPKTMHELQMLQRNKHIDWAGRATDPITPRHADAAVQLQTIRNVTGLDVDRPL